MTKFYKQINGFPAIRMRRNRMRVFSRRMISETHLNANNLIQPLFVTQGKYENTYIESMPGVKRHSIKSVAKEAMEIYKLGIAAIAIFPYIPNDLKDENATESLNKNNVICNSGCVIHCKNNGICN